VVDWRSGVLRAGERRDAGLLAMAEPLLLAARARTHGDARGRVTWPTCHARRAGVWDFELHLARDRVGLALLPALLELRSHGDARVRAWAQAGRAYARHGRSERGDDPGRRHSQPRSCARMANRSTSMRCRSSCGLVAADKIEVREAARAVSGALRQERDLAGAPTVRRARRQAGGQALDAERSAREAVMRWSTRRARTGRCVTREGHVAVRHWPA